MTGLRKLYHEFPRRFWIVVFVHFVDKIGGTLAFPFFALYITGKFGVGMTEAASSSASSHSPGLWAPSSAERSPIGSAAGS